MNKTILNYSKKIIQKLLNDCSGSRNQCQTKLFLCKTKNQFETIKKDNWWNSAQRNLDLQNRVHPRFFDQVRHETMCASRVGQN